MSFSKARQLRVIGALSQYDLDSQTPSVAKLSSPPARRRLEELHPLCMALGHGPVTRIYTKANSSST